MITSHTILLIEDNRDDEDLTVRALRKNKIANDIQVARDGAEALDILFADGAELPQLIVLDLNLPKISGLEVLRRIRSDERTRLLPVVVMTSSQEDEDIIQSYSLGANGYVRKPVDFTQFSEAVRLLGLYWLVLNQSPVRR